MIELCPNSCIIRKKESFPDTNAGLANNMHNLVSCTVVSMKHVESSLSCTAMLPFVHHISWQKEILKHLRYDIFSVLSVLVCTTRPTKIRISVSQLYPKFRIMDKKGRFHDTPVQRVQNEHRFASGAIGKSHTARKRKTM